MIVNDKHKFIFFHVPRTGGKSVREMWSNTGTKYRQHMTYKQATKQLSINFDDYFKFGFIRNPWERVFSLYCKHEQTTPALTKGGFKVWMFNEKRPDSQRHKQSALSMIGGVDHIACFENFEQEWDFIFDKIGLTRVKLPYVNERRGGKSYQLEYDDEMKEFIREYHQEDIDYGSYTYD